MDANRFFRMALVALGHIALLGVIAPPAASASSTKGKVTKLYAREDGLHLVILDTSASGRPACAGYQPYYIIKAEGSAYAQSQFAMLLSAYLTGRTITVEGTGACTRWGDGEDIGIVSFE